MLTTQSATEGRAHRQIARRRHAPQTESGTTSDNARPSYLTGSPAGEITNQFPPTPWPLVSPALVSPEKRYSGWPL